MKKIVLATGNDELTNQIKKLKDVDVIEEDEDIDVIIDLLNYVSCDFIVVNILLNPEKSLKLAISAREKGIRIIALVSNKKSMRSEIAALSGVGVYAFAEFDALYKISEFISDYPEDYDYAELAETKNSNKNGETHPSQTEKKKTTIAVLGTMHRIGVTTQAVRMTKYLNESGYKAIYIESNQTGYVQALFNAYEGVSETAGILRYAEIDMLPESESRRIRDVLDMPYTHYVYDYGTIEEAAALNWIEKDMKVLICGTNPQELPSFQKAIRLMYEHKPKFIFSFSADSEHAAIGEMMSDSATDTFFSGYIPDPFEGRAEDMYGDVINVMQRRGNPEKIKQNKTKGLFGRRSK